MGLHILTAHFCSKFEIYLSTFQRLDCMGDKINILVTQLLVSQQTVPKTYTRITQFHIIIIIIKLDWAGPG